MKREKILKAIVVLIIGTILFVMSTNVFAADVDFFEDTTNQLNTTNTTNTNNATTNTVNTTNTNSNVNTVNTTNTTNTTSTVNTSTTNTNNYNTNLPKAGAPENAMLGVAITVLAVVAIFAYKKINQYKNI